MRCKLAVLDRSNDGVPLINQQIAPTFLSIWFESFEDILNSG
ncbi:hypothetical protein AALP_AA5G058400 [Arabis alpina]|uniref:Uncharacterized protein n=1 Tax=Arabis alpina TaxID=50452 RepID=A0A087GV72_ARAAL|nr:hypothetical protein AALP_AA5G058400 [Arabis alpina]